MLRFRDRESYAGNKTKEYDDLAMKYLSYLLFFLVVCFSIYSLMYDRHKSWYSWILSSLTSCVYMFGKYLSLDIFFFLFIFSALHFALLKYSPGNIFVPVCIWIACGYSHSYLRGSDRLEKSSYTVSYCFMKCCPTICLQLMPYVAWNGGVKCKSNSCWSNFCESIFYKIFYCLSFQGSGNQ